MLRVHDEHGIRVLTMDRPPVNALSGELLIRIRQSLADAQAAGATAVVLTGREGMFSAGLDLVELLTLDRTRLEAFLGAFFDLMGDLAAAPIPVVAAISGHCPAGGTVLSLFCDVRIMAAGDYGIGLNEVRVGIPMPRVVAELAVRTLGARRAEEALVAGRLYDPRAAAELGFVDEVAPLGEVVPRSIARARDLVAAPPYALAVTRERLRSDLRDLVERHRDADVTWLADAWFTDEVQVPLREAFERLSSRD
jgi:enoyl-CoA hydratase/carnithine racemase